MTISIQHIKIALLGLGLILVGLLLGYTRPALAGISSISSQSCTVSTVVAAPVGNQISSTLLSGNSRRAWAIIQQPINASNTVSVAFNAGTAATLTSGIQLTQATTTSPLVEITFGLNTDFPYTGAVTGITASASSTVNITQCVY